MSGVDRTQAELLVQLSRTQTRRRFLAEQRAEATRRIAECDREEERIQRHLHYLERSEKAAC